MIRFIIIGNQIDEDNDDYAFYDTVSDRFIEFNDTSVFTLYSSWRDTKETFLLYAFNHPLKDRCLDFIENYYNSKYNAKQTKEIKEYEQKERAAARKYSESIWKGVDVDKSQAVINSRPIMKNSFIDGDI